MIMFTFWFASSTMPGTMMPAITIQITATDIIINLKLSFFISSFKSYEFTIFISILRSDYHGSKILIVVPHPGSLSTESTALWCSKMIATRDIPIPAPPSFLALDLSAI